MCHYQEQTIQFLYNNKGSAILVTDVGLSMLQLRGPWSLSATYYGTFFRFFPHAHAGLTAAAGGDEVVGVLGELVS